MWWVGEAAAGWSWSCATTRVVRHAHTHTLPLAAPQGVDFFAVDAAPPELRAFFAAGLVLPLAFFFGPSSYLAGREGGGGGKSRWCG